MLSNDVRSAVRTFYDCQGLRIRIGLRIVAQAKRGALSPACMAMIQGYAEQAAAMEREAAKYVSELAAEFDILPWLLSVRGISNTSAAVLVSEIQTASRFETITRLWSYAGLGVDNATGRACQRRRGVRAPWNHFLKTKLLGVIGPNFLRTNSPYRKFYDDYKNRIANIPCSMAPKRHKKEHEDDEEQNGKPAVLLPNGCTKGHMHAKATRYMCKWFLYELWKTWRELEGLEVRQTYAAEKLGIVHHNAPVYANP